MLLLIMMTGRKIVDGHYTGSTSDVLFSLGVDHMYLSCDGCLAVAVECRQERTLAVNSRLQGVGQVS